MTLQTFKGAMWTPAPLRGIQGSTPSITADSIITTTGGVALLFRAPKTGTISKLAFLVSSVTTNGTLDARLETVDATNGQPTGTLVGTNTNATFTPSAGWTTITMTAGASVTGGDPLALVIKATGVSVSVTIGTQFVGPSGAMESIFPYPMRLSGGTWSKRTTRPIMALEYNDGSYDWVPDAYPVSAIALTAYNTGSAADEYALKFKLPFPARCSGWWSFIQANGDFDMVLYDSDGSTVLKSQSNDKDIVQVASTTGLASGKWSSGQALLANTFYYLSAKPTSATNITIARLSVNAAAIMDSLEGGQNFHEASRADAGSWTPTTTNRPCIGLLLDQFDDGGNTTEVCSASAG